MMASGVMWPLPVAASEPYRPILSFATLSRMPKRCRSSTKILAARMGPTVWLDEGPTPIEKRSVGAVEEREEEEKLGGERSADEPERLGEGEGVEGGEDDGPKAEMTACSARGRTSAGTDSSS